MITLRCLLIFALEATVVAVLLSVFLSFALAWYERANSEPQLIERRFNLSGLSLPLWLMVQEAACLLITLLLRPLGWLPHKLPAGQVGDGDRVVILLHGLFQNRSCLLWLAYRLRQAGFRHVYSINTPPWRDLETLTEILVRKVDELRLTHKVEQVDLVGHSMGGMIGRNYVQHRGGSSKVGRLVTLGSPHQGSKLAPFALSKMGRSLQPGSTFLKRFNQGDWPETTMVTTIYSRHDNIILPIDSARIKGLPAVELDGMGHTALLFHPRALQAVVDALKKEPT